MTSFGLVFGMGFLLLVSLVIGAIVSALDTWFAAHMPIFQVVLEIGDVKRLTQARVVQAGTDEDELARRLLLEKYGGPGENLTGWSRTSLPVAIAWRPAA